MKKFLLVILVALLAAGFVSANGQQGSSASASAPASATYPSKLPAGLSGDDLAFAKFTEPVDVHIGMSVSPIDTTLAPGESAGNNYYTKTLKELYNINVIVDWTAAEGNDYNQRTSLAIASNAMPDAMVVNNLSYLTKAAKTEMLYNLGPMWDLMASTQVKGIEATTKGRARDMVSVDGTMVGIPNITVATDGVIVMNVQKNWLDELGLAVPKTVADIEKVARAIKAADPAGNGQTIPITGPDKSGKLYSTFLESSNLSHGFDPIFQAHDVWPGYFLDAGGGKATYGSLDPKMKDVLTVLARWYKDGLIDPEMGVRDSEGELVNANRNGIWFGPWWAIGYGNGDSYKNNPKVNWQTYPVYTDDGKWFSHMKAPGMSATIINKNADPNVVAAILIMNNHLVANEMAMQQATDAAIGWYPLRTVEAAGDETEHEYRELTKVLEGTASPEDYNDPKSIYKNLYADAQVVKSVIPGWAKGKELATTDFDQSQWNFFSRMLAIFIGDRPYSTIPVDKEVYSLTYSTSDLIEQRWANLWKLESETMMQIVTGKQPVSAFDKFATDWLAQGGQAILDDVAATYLK
ncbi:MAG: extracellular solute-binding protein [Spirochaetaceae bacterium]|jgi:multiple sugar transport system substrate-binding protein/putative aldouronate transport system substrate-binding protein|nr:extracellular solute-binding protein [Spirochaetaceae bacterium]